MCVCVFVCVCVCVRERGRERPASDEGVAIRAVEFEEAIEERVPHILPHLEHKPDLFRFSVPLTSQKYEAVPRRARM